MSEGRTDNYLLSELRRLAKLGGAGFRVYVGLDADAGGAAGMRQVCPQVMRGAGLSAVQVMTVHWPEKDVNRWLQLGGTAEAAAEMLAEAEPWLRQLLDEALPVDGRSDDEAVRAVFAALAGLDPFEIEKVRDEICERLNLRRRMFDGLLRAARRDAGMNDDGQPKYFVQGGRIFCRYFDAQGGEVVDALCNFEAAITHDVMRDNGQELLREFRVRGAIGKLTLPAARVRADEFSKMDWPMREWGSRAIIEAGARRRDQLRAAIQHLSRDVERMTIYTHTGWREVDGRRFFLTAAGAVGADGIQVELDNDLELYQVPTQANDPAGAMAVSLRLLDVAPAAIAFPIWGAMWLPPLRELINMAFTLWVFGGSGAMKSTLVALAMNHYGAGFDDKHLPASFIDTANRLEQKAFITKDCPFVIDDFAPQKDARSFSEYTRTAHRIVRAAGNLTGRGRLAADSSARTTYDPRSLVIITGEDLPESESLVARLFVVEMTRGDVDKERLSVLQQQRGRLGHAMSGYLSWLAGNWSWAVGSVPERWRQYRQQAFGCLYHLRLPEAVAGLMVGIEMGVQYALTLGAISEAQRVDLLRRGWEALQQSATAMAQRVSDEKPERLFLRTLSDLLTQGKVYLRPADGVGNLLGGPSDNGELLGWYDADRFFLLPEATYGRVARHFRDLGNVFPVRETTLRKMLAEVGVLEMGADGRRTVTKQLDGQVRRVLVVRRAKFQEIDDDDGKGVQG